MLRSISFVILMMISCKLKGEFLVGYPLHFNDMNSPLFKALEISYKDIGIKPKFISLPAVRLLDEVKNGSVDADIARTTEVEKNANLVRVDFSLGNLKTYAVWRKNDFVHSLNLNDLSKVSVGILHGSIVSEAIVKNNVNVERVNSIEQLKTILDSKRVSYIILVDVSSLTKNPNYESSQLNSFPIYHYLALKNEKLKIPLMKSMKKNINEKLKVEIQHVFDSIGQTEIKK
jgi:hypothetical protein